MGAWRHVFLTLAMLAVAFKVAIPPGFMAGSAGAAAPFGVVLCTSQGAVMADSGAPLSHGDAPDPSRGAHDSPCAFAGHGLGGPPPAASIATAVTFVAYAASVPKAPTGLTPGRGLTAPPPPARGPPSLLI